MRHRPGARFAAGLWFSAGILYLATERLAASAFSPAYSYADNYISDLGVPVCGSVFAGVPICSPFHALMNVDFVVQGVLFLGAAIAVSRSLATPARFAFVGLAALNCAGNTLVGVFPETSPAQFAGARYHVIGAFLAIVCGNGTALLSAWAFSGLRLAGFHRYLSIALPLLAAGSLIMLASGSETKTLLPDGVWERISVYTITIWELASAACLIARRG
jgi:hypothetical membrane protein